MFFQKKERERREFLAFHSRNWLSSYSLDKCWAIFCAVYHIFFSADDYWSASGAIKIALLKVFYESYLLYYGILHLVYSWDHLDSAADMDYTIQTSWKSHLSPFHAYSHCSQMYVPLYLSSMHMYWLLLFLPYLNFNSYISFMAICSPGLSA